MESVSPFVERVAYGRKCCVFQQRRQGDYAHELFLARALTLAGVGEGQDDELIFGE